MAEEEKKEEIETELEPEEKIFIQVLTWIEKNKNLNKTVIENRITEEIRKQNYLEESWQEGYAKRRIKEKIRKEAEGKLSKRYDLRFLLGWGRHFTPKNLIINSAISFIPMAMVFGIFTEIGLGGGLLFASAWVAFISLAGVLREKTKDWLDSR